MSNKDEVLAPWIAANKTQEDCGLDWERLNKTLQPRQHMPPHTPEIWIKSMWGIYESLLKSEGIVDYSLRGLREAARSIEKLSEDRLEESFQERMRNE